MQNAEIGQERVRERERGVVGGNGSVASGLRAVICGVLRSLSLLAGFDMLGVACVLNLFRHLNECAQK